MSEASAEVADTAVRTAYKNLREQLRLTSPNHSDWEARIDHLRQTGEMLRQFGE